MAIERDQDMQATLPHERLDVYRLYVEVASLCGDIVSSATRPIVVFDHLDRAMESIGVNFMRANGQAPGSAQRTTYLDVSIASAHECAASLDVCFARRAIEEGTYTASMGKLWRIRGMLLGLKRVSVTQVREGSVPYGTPRFPFAELDMYQASLEGVRWTHDLLEELASRARARRKLDVSTTGTVLNIAEGHGRASIADQNRFMKTAQEHAFQTLLLLDLMVARDETTASRVADGKATQARVISMLHAWCASNERIAEPQE
jgi:four helix bundle protein